MCSQPAPRAAAAATPATPPPPTVAATPATKAKFDSTPNSTPEDFRKQTFLTTPLGAPGDANTTKKKLLGQ